MIKSRMESLGLEALLMNYNNNVFQDIKDMSMDFSHKIYLEEVLQELLLNVLMKNIKKELIIQM